MESLVLVASVSCGSGDSCPKVFAIGERDLLVQGYRLTDSEKALLPACPPGEDVVRIPIALIEEILIQLDKGEMGAMP